MKKFYSIIIPIKNQENKIFYNLKKLVKILKTFKCIQKWELILIDDGSTDNTIKEIIRFKKKSTNIKLLKNRNNKGKGYSIKKGVKLISAKSDKVVLIDSDIPYFKYLKFFFNSLSINNLVIINRKDKKSKLIIKDKSLYIFYRIFVGHFLNFIFRIIRLTNLKDTQAGLKGFDSSFKKIFKKVKTYGFLFDLEFLLILNKKKIYPQSIACNYSVSKKSSIGFNFFIYFRILSDFFIIVYNHIRKNYD